MPPLPLTAVFDDLPDPRRETASKLHGLTDILAIATCAVIGGADGCWPSWPRGRSLRRSAGGWPGPS